VSDTLRRFAPDKVDIDGKSILVTGGTGSFGRRFIRRVLEKYNPRRLIVFSRDELKQYEMAQELPEARHPAIRYFIGDVRDQSRLELALRDVDYVIHTAALKHVTIAEYNPFECVYTNVHGAENVVRAALRTGVKKVVALSTDKAANPINLYGASKLASDRIFIAGNNLSAGLAHFSVVRYGNVVGSRGSVVPYFKKLIAEGVEELPITDPKMTRFWITLDQGVDFVLFALANMIGGEMFVPKIPSMRITDLAQAMLPGGRCKTVGIRPGEKLHEVMVPAEEARNTLEYENYYVIEPTLQFWTRQRYEESHGGTRPRADFQYDSLSNSEWLTSQQLQRMIDGI
jgi:UDP-N-acetylglucosamine 4,6-dehydratase/5-epimerase